MIPCKRFELRNKYEQVVETISVKQGYRQYPYRKGWLAYAMPGQETPIHSVPEQGLKLVRIQ